MSTEQFQVGDSVQKKDQKEPIMIVAEVRCDGSVLCKWSQGPNNELHCSQFFASTELAIVQKHNYLPEWPRDVV